MSSQRAAVFLRDRAERLLNVMARNISQVERMSIDEMLKEAALDKKSIQELLDRES